MASDSHELTPFVHPTALCESAQVGAGTRVWAFAHVMEGAHIGDHCNVGDHAFVESGVRVGDRVTIKNSVLLWTGVEVEDDVFLGPNAVFTNDLRPRAFIKRGSEVLLPTVVARGATVGANTTVVAGVRIGEWAMVGAGTVVTRDVPAHALFTGNPGKVRGWVCRCGNTLDENLACPDCASRYALRAAGPDSGLEPVE